MTLELIEDAKGDRQNAQFMALASDLAYLPEAEGADAFRSQLGLEARLFSVGNTQAYVATSDGHIVVAFRGTESPTSIDGLKDWLLSDALNLLILPEGDLGTDYVAAGVGVRFHQGFMKALADIWVPSRGGRGRAQEKRPPFVADRTQSRRGSGRARGLALQRKFVPVNQIYTFGGPMVGNDIAAKAIDRELAGRIFRYVNVPDPVPLLPSVSLIANHYAHCESEISLGAAAESFLELLKQKADKTVDGLLNATLVEDIWKSLEDRVSAHFMDSYRKLVSELKK